MLRALLAALIILVAFLAGAVLGYYLRRVVDLVLNIRGRVVELRRHQDNEKSTPSTGFAEPMTRAEMAAMLEEEKIDLLNGRTKES